ncbi:Ribosomal RNA methyltransferase (FmrO) (plasmid) [Klebsiella pneumoniae]|uniref:RmtE family 16S rRNA (guanine(1405)-N(7))-methyltransferase n=2 Tax=Klebsiella TaxID=570 RepID=UPI000C7C1347|nr:MULTISPECIES: RmtE family 16S rRNA (guanine(1405)-N(7))-methyltransferase [Klebsiella]PLH29110.1 hypothetical protein B6J26_17080 [Klebsiella pneumoniae]CAH1460273.1 Ribosomal RNA methyltransferase (FmrO) [Klebsiella quasipneumoniae]CAH1480070.1 Ribosomal RNA methyltransferase (FmrO) [Klebsiella pneumoniae]CAH1480499.1 Ribosomal RNA methyltransferase (FmrO) [Klebsiella pneumoniae]CAH1481004.1 Ribosomal RNA methyltransferase (FmrO) [Klebsiella pneumoniae]
MNIDEMVAEVLSSKKYTSVDPAVVRRVCMETAPKYPKKKEAIKAVKNELHIIHEVFLQNECYKNALSFLSQLSLDFNNAQLIDITMQIMQSHTSTKERLGDIEAVCSFLSTHISKEGSVMDIGCGFNPFALPLLHEFPATYYAYDICSEGIDILNKYFSILKKGEYRAELLDAVSVTPKEKVDVALLFKLLPLLQQQKKGRGFSILEELDFDKAIISFPIKSLGGKQKGMETFYSNLFEENLPSSLEIIEKQTFSNEMFYVIQNKTINGGNQS